MPQYPKQEYMTISNSPALHSPGCFCSMAQQLRASTELSSSTTGQLQKGLPRWKENVQQESIIIR